MKLDNAKAQMRKGVLELCILSALKKGELYPSDIIEQLKTANIIVAEGTIYPLLTRLKNAEILTYRWEESNSGPPRKYYAITEKGNVLYNELEGSWAELISSVGKILNR